MPRVSNGFKDYLEVNQNKKMILRLLTTRCVRFFNKNFLYYFEAYIYYQEPFIQALDSSQYTWRFFWQKSKVAGRKGDFGK